LGALGLHTQEVKDDIGDKSVFIFNDLPEAEQAPWIAAARQRAGAYTRSLFSSTWALCTG
jgi:hypothetical protein